MLCGSTCLQSAKFVCLSTPISLIKAETSLSITNNDNDHFLEKNIHKGANIGIMAHRMGFVFSTVHKKAQFLVLSIYILSRCNCHF